MPVSASKIVLRAASTSSWLGISLLSVIRRRVEHGGPPVAT
jgi:hypothetical protein